MQFRTIGIGTLALFFLAKYGTASEARIVDIRTNPAKDRLSSICHFIKELEAQMSAQRISQNDFHSVAIIHSLACDALLKPNQEPQLKRD